MRRFTLRSSGFRFYREARLSRGVAKNCPFSTLGKAPVSCPVTSSADIVRRAIKNGLTERIVRDLRARGVDVETVLLSDRAIDETLRDLRILSGVFSAFVMPGSPGDKVLSCIKRDWQYGTWPLRKVRSTTGALFAFDGVDWAGAVETSVLSDPVRKRRYENVSVRLPTDGCLLRADSDAEARGEIVAGSLRLHQHNRAFYEMTPLGATLLKPICDYMLHMVGAPAESTVGVDLEVFYCGTEDRLDLKCVDRRAAPELVRTLQVCFEPGWPVAPVPPSHPGPWAGGGGAAPGGRTGSA